MRALAGEGVYKIAPANDLGRTRNVHGVLHSNGFPDPVSDSCCLLTLLVPLFSAIVGLTMQKKKKNEIDIVFFFLC